jgi:hypothetical protein
MDVDDAGVVRRLRQMILNFEAREVRIRITDDMKEPEQLIAMLRKQGVEFVNPSKNDGPITAQITEFTSRGIDGNLTGGKDQIAGSYRLRMHDLIRSDGCIIFSAG